MGDIVQWQFLTSKRKSLMSRTVELGPVPSFNSSWTPIGSRLLLYGGCDYDGEPLEQVFLYDTKAYQWISPEGVLGENSYEDASPGKRYGHCCVLVEMHPPRLMLYGGMVKSESTYDESEFDAPDTLGDSFSSNDGADLQGLDGVFEHGLMGWRNKWSTRKAKNSNFGAEELDGSLYFLTLAQNGSWSWSKPLINSKIRPPSRTDFSIVKVRTNVCMMFGGYTSDNKVVGDLWSLDYQNLEWREEAVSGIKPRPRYRHTAEVIGNKMYILGGVDNGDDDATQSKGSTFATINVLNLETMEWSQPKLSGENPFPRSGHSSCVVGTDHIAVFGGKLKSDVYYNDVHLIDVKTFRSVCVDCVQSMLPSAVDNSALQPVGKSIYCFAGTDAQGSCYNDIRTLDVESYLGNVDINVIEGSASEYSFKVLLIGESAVGKTSLMTRFSENLFTVNTHATIGIDYNSRMIKIDGKVVKLEIWDTAGQEKFGNITANYYRGAQGALLAYDVGSRSSFELVQTWYEKAKMLGGEKLVAVLVGNKCDLGPEQRQVTHEEGAELASSLGIQFLETSAKNGQNVDDSFVCMTREIKRRVDQSGLVGVGSATKHASRSTVTLAKGDRKMSMSEKCCR